MTLHLRRLLAALLIAAAGLAPSADAQTSMVDVVHLHDGTVVRGVILEQVPGESLRIRTADGSEFVFAMADVSRILREPGTPSTAVVTPVPAPTAVAARPALSPNPGVEQPVPGGQIPVVKNPSTATLFSVLIVGGGQFYAGETGKGLLLLGGAIAIPVLTATLFLNDVGSCYNEFDCYNSVSDGTTLLYVGWAASLGLWAYGIFDAAPAAHRANRRAAGLAQVSPAVLRDPVSGDLAYGGSVRLRF